MAGRLRGGKYKRLGEAIRRERVLHNRRQGDIARKLRVEQGRIARIESGSRRIDVIEYLAIAKIVGFDPCAILREIDPCAPTYAKPPVPGKVNGAVAVT